MSVVKVKRSRDAPLERPILVRSFQASSTYLRKLASAFGPGSVAMTSNPRARYSAAQLAPITPVPTMAMRRIGLLYDILVFSELFGLRFNGLTIQRINGLRVFLRKRCR